MLNYFGKILKEKEINRKMAIVILMHISKTSMKTIFQMLVTMLKINCMILKIIFLKMLLIS